jgi:citrate lyase subunit beta/citryl-CoA lyase
MSVTERLSLVRSALFLPASNARAVEKARGLNCDLAILDLEDAVKAEDKDVARDSAVAALGADWMADVVAIRINGVGTPWHEKDIAALSGGLQLMVVPKVESAEEARVIAGKSGTAFLAMIETPQGVYAAREIAAVEGVVGLIAGTNDLGAELHIPSAPGRAGLALALQSIVLAARAAGGVALDGVYNRLDDPAGFENQCREGRSFGFDGKTLIHPNQIDPCNRLFGPDESELEDAKALIDAASGGAERFRGRMIESMHVESARRLVKRARQ